jgi:DNA-binding CsgD family transcriptional regulator
MLALVIRLGPDPAAPLGALAIHRPQTAENFDTPAIRRVVDILPHVRRSLQVRSHLRAAAAATGQAAVAMMLEAMPDAALVCDGHARVLHANRAAEAADFERIISLRGRGDGRTLAARLAGETSRLHASIAQAARGGAGATVRLGAQAFALVSLLPAGFAARIGAPAGLVLVVLRRVPAASPDLIGAARAVLGLTQAEAEAACSLASGLGPEEIARQRDVRLSTVRTLLARGMARAGADNLRQLAALLAVLPRPPADPAG